MEINEENLLPLNSMNESSNIEETDYVMKWATTDEDPSKISFQNFVANVKEYIVEGFETSKEVDFFGAFEPSIGVFNNMLWLNTSDAKIYRYVQVPDVWQFVELTSPTTVYLCDMSLLVGTEDFGSYSIVVVGANNWYTLSYYKGVDLLDRQEMLDLINTKVDKVVGKSLIADTEITRLAGVYNYNDTELRALINSRRAKITNTQINGTDVVLNVLGNTYYYFTKKLTSLTISDVNVDEQETILEFTTGNSFVFSYPVGLYNLYGNDINNNERILIAIHNGVMEIRKNVQHITTDEKADYAIKSYKTELVAAPSSGGTLTLKNGYITVISTTLTNSHSFTIALPTPISGYCNECGVKFKIGASLPTIVRPTIAKWRSDEFIAAINSSRVIIFEQDTFNGTTWENYATCDKN